jgi:hypothetical protein
MEKGGGATATEDGLGGPSTKGCANVRTLSGLNQNYPDHA